MSRKVAETHSTYKGTITNFSRVLLTTAGYFILLLIFLVPYLWLMGSSFRPREEIFKYMFPLSIRTFLPQNPTINNFLKLFEETNFNRAMLNSLGIACVTVVSSLTINSMAAFAIARLRFRLRKIIFVLILATLLVPFEVLIVPMYRIIQQLGFDDSFAGVILPWISNPFVIFLLYHHFADLPQELMEAALVDGCTYFRIFWNIMLPNIKSALVSAAFIQFIWTWDAYIWPLIIIRDPQKEILTVSIARLFTDQDIGWELILSGSFLATIPVIVLFIFLQKYYVEGIASYGIKG